VGRKSAVISRLRGAALIGVVAAALVGCGPINDALEDTRGPVTVEKFSVATRERLDEDPDGRTFRIMIQANEPATWADAETAMMESLEFRCADGEEFVQISTEPAINLVGLGTDQPAGTTFVETYTCAGPYPGEFAIEPGLTPAAGRARIQARLVGDGELLEGRHLIASVPHDDRRRKYPAIDLYVGGLVARARAACPDGDVVLHELVVGNFPKPERRHDSPNVAGMLIGTDIECVPRAPADAADNGLPHPAPSAPATDAR
jgi:hypothetical protein